MDYQAVLPHAERANRARRHYETIDRVYDALCDFVTRYNTDWLIEKDGLCSPSDARAASSQAVMR
jgi:hypothetical protein